MAARTERPQKKQENYLHRRKESYMASANNQQVSYPWPIHGTWDLVGRGGFAAALCQLSPVARETRLL